MMRALVACEFSQAITKELRELGHEAYSCDLEPTEGNPEWHIQGDVLKYLETFKWDLVIAHPPCTYLAVCGNKWFKPEFTDRFPNRALQREEAIHFFMAFTNISATHVAIENPIGIMSRIYRKPDQIIHPWQFGHYEPKKTCLWLKNLPKLIPTNIVEPEYMISKSGKRLPKWYFQPSYTPERQRMRNRTFEGIAKAMATQWAGHA